MTRKFTFLLMALLALAGFKSWGQNTLTVYENGTANGEIPLNTGWIDTPNTISQCIIPASELGAMTGGTISQMQFYIYQAGQYSSIQNAVLECSLGEVATTTITSAITAGLTPVWSGNLNFSETNLTVTFTTPYQYNGSNLLISFKVITTDSYTNYKFYGITTNYNSCYSSQYIETNKFLPKTTFTYTGGSSCIAPTGLAASNITAEGATISWTGNGAESYDLAYGVASTFDLSNPSTYTLQNNLTTTSVQLSGLTAETEYKCAVKAHCSDEEESAWSSAVAFTPSAKTTLTVNDGTETNPYVPIYGFYADANCRSQFIIPSSVLGDMVGGTVSDMTFYLNSTSNVSFTGTWNVYVKEVDNATLSGFVSWDDLGSAVYYGNITITNGLLSINFATPIAYNGHNLLIGFNEIYTGNYSSTSWLGVNQSSNTAWYSTYSNAGDAQQFLPKTTFTYMPGATTEYTVNLHVNGVVTEETITSMPAAPTAPAGLTFCGWTTSDITTYATDAPTYVTSLSDEITDLYAVFSYSEMGGTTAWTKVTDFSELNDNDVVIIGAVQNGNSGYTMNEFSEMSSSATCPALPATFSNDGTTITELHEGTTHFTVTKNPYNYGDIYLQGESGKNLSSFWTYNLNIPTGWEEYVGDEFNDIITFDNGNLIISYTEDWDELYVILRNTDQYGGINMRFGVEHIQDGVYYAAYLYKQQGTLTNYYMTSVLTEGTVANATVKNIIVVNPITVSGRLEMNAAGLFRNEDAANFVFADGAQFYYTGEETVKATFEKEITGYTGDNDNYYLIANPTDNDVVANLTSNEYDLYSFDPWGDEDGYEWINEEGEEVYVKPYSNEDGSAVAVGYLYANREDVTLEFAGVLNPAGSTDIELTYAEEGEGIDFPGFNLIGNPYACKAYVSGYSFYKMVNGELQVNNARTATIAPCEGVFVEATAANQQVNVTTTAPNVGEDDINVNVTKNSRGEVIDRAVISFDGRNDMHKFMMNPANTNIRLAKNGQEYAAISCDAEGEIPVSFKAAEDDTYTITVNANNENTRYLHLIDNLTGMDVDLLANPSYTFNALTSDYAYRFKLVFSMNIDNNQSDNTNNFAFMSDGNLVINNIDGEATLQIVDVLGRVVSTEIVSGSYNKALNLKSGLYILNLNGMTQKIVVE